jgi:hypothetical protein
MAFLGIPLINGKSYEHADVTVIVMGVTLISVTGVEYDESPKIKNIYTTGRYPTSRIHGSIEPTAKLTVLMEDVEALRAAAPQGRLYLFPEFDVIVTFTDASLLPVVHTIKNCRFTDSKVTSTTGDDAIPVELPLVISHVDYGK